MKRDLELIRKMVLFIEGDPSGWAPSRIEIDGYTAHQIGYHSYLLVDSGLAVGSDVSTTGSSGPYYLISHLTSAGHDFADNARNQYVWDEVMDDIHKRGLKSAALEIVKKLLNRAIKKRLIADPP